MRFFLKLCLIGTVVVLVVVYHNDLVSQLYDLWTGVFPSPTSHPVVQSAQRAGAAVNGLMKGVGHAFGR